MQEFLTSSWFWWAFALALFAAEALVPGAFMLWLGFAAVAMGLLTLVLDFALWLQWSVFGVLALVSVWIGWKVRSSSPPAQTDQPLLNRRARQYVGRVITLDEPIVNGLGRARVGDTVWLVAGPDLPGGTRVRVVGAETSRLIVEPAG